MQGFGFVPTGGVGGGSGDVHTRMRLLLDLNPLRYHPDVLNVAEYVLKLLQLLAKRLVLPALNSDVKNSARYRSFLSALRISCRCAA
jgi:hypothetical protein